MKAPCKDCEKRHPNCHSECEEYQAFWRAKRVENEKRLIEHTVTSIMLHQKKKLFYQKQRHKRRGGGKDDD